MSLFLLRIRALVATGNVRVSDHGFHELRDDGIRFADLLSGLKAAEVIEEYADYHKGHAFLCYSTTLSLRHCMSSGESRGPSQVRQF